MNYYDYFSDDFLTTISIRRISKISDSMGGFTRSETTVVSFTGAVWQKSDREVVDSDRVGVRSTHTIAASPVSLSSVYVSDYAYINSKKYKINRVNNIMDKDDLSTLDVELIE